MSRLSIDSRQPFCRLHSHWQLAPKLRCTLALPFLLIITWHVFPNLKQKLKKHLTLKPASPSTIALQLVHFQVTQGAAQRRMEGITESHTCDSHNRRPHPHHDHHCHPALKTIFNCGTCLGVDFFYQVHIFNLEDCVDIDLRVHQSSSDNRRQGLLFDSHWRQGILKLRQD